MKDYCTLRSLVVRVQARTFMVWKFDIFGFLGSDDDDTTRHDNNTETPDPGQPPLPGTKYLVRISPHFDIRRGHHGMIFNFGPRPKMGPGPGLKCVRAQNGPGPISENCSVVPPLRHQKKTDTANIYIYIERETF